MNDYPFYFLKLLISFKMVKGDTYKALIIIFTLALLMLFFINPLWLDISSDYIVINVRLFLFF